jgi:hypothetical protein
VYIRVQKAISYTIKLSALNIQKVGGIILDHHLQMFFKTTPFHPKFLAPRQLLHDPRAGETSWALNEYAYPPPPARFLNLRASFLSSFVKLNNESFLGRKISQ